MKHGVTAAPLGVPCVAAALLGLSPAPVAGERQPRAAREVAAEAYFNGEGRDTLHDIRSAGKSVTSLAVGVAIDRGLVAGVQARLTTLMPKPAAPDKARISLEDVLTMRSGLEADDEDPSVIAIAVRLGSDSGGRDR